MNTSLGDSLPCFVCGVPTSYLRLQEVNVRDKKEWQLVGYTAFPLCAEHNTDEAAAAAAEQFAKAINPKGEIKH